ncbi:MAG: hypothetical protein NVS1B4_03570 [Gemmatimonadaceae bacterium]
MAGGTVRAKVIRGGRRYKHRRPWGCGLRTLAYDRYERDLCTALWPSTEPPLGRREARRRGVTARVLTGGILAAVVAILARRARSLSPSGSCAAWLVGAVCVSAGWNWALLLVAFFLTSTALSKVGASTKEVRTRGVVSKDGARDAAQVMANGGIFAALALASLILPSPLWAVAGGGAIAAATADTWATEIGTLVGDDPRSILTGRRLAPGMSGGVTVPGTLAGICGAGFIAILTLALGATTRASVAIAAGGILGTMVDSCLGATLQDRRSCPLCHVATEQLVHSCHTQTDHVGGIAWLDNDWVNAAGALSGAIGALSLAGP